MMRAAKRGATSDLNHENWNQDEESEDPGVFEQAPSDVINRRKIRVARRRGTGSENAGTGGLFKSFTGFAGSTGLAGAAVPTFNFGGDKAPGEAAKRALPDFGFKKSEEHAVKAPIFQFGAAPSGLKQGASTFSFSAKPTGPPAKTASEEVKTKTVDEASKDELSTRDRHLHMLRSLNLSVNKWISSHVEKDPYCDLTPVFADYEKHLREIEKKYPYEADDVNETVIEAKKVEKTVPNSKPAPSVAVAPTNGKEIFAPKSSFSFFSPGASTSPSKPPIVAANFGLSTAQLTAVSKEKECEDEASDDAEEEDDAKEEEEDKEEEKETKKTEVISFPSKPFSFGFDPLKKKETEAAGEEEEKKPAPTLFSGMNFTFGSTSTPAPFSFDLGSGTSSFASAAPPSSTEKEDEEYVPPKTEVKEIKEEGAILTKRCKLFYKWEEAWHDKGVGNLHLKPIEKGKVQVIIRADTNLGNILLNVMLTKIIPITRQKNNLTLLCVPSPPMRPVKPNEDPPKSPMPLLVRFKTEAETEEVLKEIEKLREEE